MGGVLAAEPAVFVHFQPVGVVLFVFHGIVVALLALAASQSDFGSHIGASVNLFPVSGKGQPPSCKGDKLRTKNKPPFEVKPI